jgi:hypothetical protein
MSIVRDYYGLKLYSDAPNRAEETVKLGGGRWITRKSGSGSARIAGNALIVKAEANHSCCLERPISRFKQIQCTVNTGSDKGATWGTGLAVHWPNGNIKVNLRFNGAFGGYVNGGYNINIGKVKPNKDYKLRIRLTSNSYVGEVQDGGKWYKVVEVSRRVFPHPPTVVRVGKTDLRGQLTNYHRSGPVGESTVKDFTLT